MRLASVISFLLIILFNVAGQSNIDNGYYLFPINPGKTNHLSGSFAEMRSSHFHTGIDIKTNKKIGFPVLAAADGYVFRIDVSVDGYGKCLYLKHPNQTFTVYAHLDGFEKNIENYITGIQYKKKCFQVKDFPESTLFTLNKGDTIGYSGNTGSSYAPHLHFEIRNNNNQPLDVVDYFVNEIVDDKSPIIKKIALKTLDSHARINRLCGRYVFDVLSEHSNRYKLKEPLFLEGKIGIEIYAYDVMNDVENKTGIQKTILIRDEDTIFYESKKLLNFNEQKYIYRHYNYPYSLKKGHKYNKLYMEKGNNLSFYKKKNYGINFDKNSLYKLKIITIDARDNRSVLAMDINRKFLRLDSLVPSFPKKEMVFFDNFIHIKTKNINKPVIGSKDSSYFLISDYYTNKHSKFFIVDLRNNFPESLLINGKKKPTHLISLVASGVNHNIKHDDFEAVIYKNSLFDTLYLRYSKENDGNIEIFSFKNDEDMLKSSIKISLKPTKNYTTKSKVYIKKTKNHYQYLGGLWNSDSTNISFNTKKLSNFVLLEDTIPPKIIPMNFNKKRVIFKIRDNLSGINQIEAYLNGLYLLMEYDPKKKLIESKLKNKGDKIFGLLELIVTDKAHNKKHLTRYLW